jgi:hypothetical protein
MKRIVCILIVLMTWAPAWAASKKITVQQLKDMLASMQQARQVDADVADKLKDIHLSEELTGSFASSLENLIPGPLSAEQIEILKGKSAFLAPPVTDIPSAPAPDAVAQKAILAKAADFASKVYAQNPHLSVIKATLRYEDELITTNSIGMHVPELLSNPLQLVGKNVDPVETDKGVEKPAASKAKTKWGENGKISEGEPGTNLGVIFPEAFSLGKIEWLRWQTIEGKQIAVFSFAVEKKKSHFNVSYCCFPKTSYATNDVVGAWSPGVVQSLSTWELFKKVVGYGGEFFINPDTGVVVRVITRAEMKPTNFVSMEDRRIDYDQVIVDGKEYVLPRIVYTVMEAVPNGDSSLAACTVRHTFFHVSYQNYKLAGVH